MDPGWAVSLIFARNRRSLDSVRLLSMGVTTGDSSSTTPLKVTEGPISPISVIKDADSENAFPLTLAWERTVEQSKNPLEVATHDWNDSN